MQFKNTPKITVNLKVATKFRLTSFNSILMDFKRVITLRERFSLGLRRWLKSPWCQWSTSWINIIESIASKYLDTTLYWMPLLGYPSIYIEPWLIEVNTNPCIEESSELLKSYIPRMLNDAFKLTIDQIIFYDGILYSTNLDKKSE